jgi:hypothetical protein
MSDINLSVIDDGTISLVLSNSGTLDVSISDSADINITLDGFSRVASDHGTPSVDEIINVSYGTGDPPAASTTTEGSLFVKYVA